MWRAVSRIPEYAAQTKPLTLFQCSPGDVFIEAGGTFDTSLPPTITVLGSVIDRTQNVIIGHGALDMILIANGTLLAIQNMTWGGKLGFQAPPTDPFFVPYHDPVVGTVAASGVMGTTHTERGLTYVGVTLSGHMVPQYQPTAAFRQLEFLLGRVSSLSAKTPFTTDKNSSQPSSSLGSGNAPAGYATVNTTGSGGGGGKNAAAGLRVPTVLASVTLASLSLFAFMV